MQNLQLQLMLITKNSPFLGFDVVLLLFFDFYFLSFCGITKVLRQFLNAVGSFKSYNSSNQECRKLKNGNKT